MLSPLVNLLLLPTVIGIIYIDRMGLEFNDKVSNWSIVYTHDSTGNTVVNVTCQLFETLNKASIYLTAKAAKDQNDKDCQIELVNTVIDGKKFLKGMQGNFLVRGFLNELLKSMDFEPNFPLPPVSKWEKFTFKTDFLLQGNLPPCQREVCHRPNPVRSQRIHQFQNRRKIFQDSNRSDFSLVFQIYWWFSSCIISFKIRRK